MVLGFKSWLRPTRLLLSMSLFCQLETEDFDFCINAASLCGNFPSLVNCNLVPRDIHQITVDCVCLRDDNFDHMKDKLQKSFFQ